MKHSTVLPLEVFAKMRPLMDLVHGDEPYSERTPRLAELQEIATGLGREWMVTPKWGQQHCDLAFASHAAPIFTLRVHLESFWGPPCRAEFMSSDHALNDGYLTVLTKLGAIHLQMIKRERTSEKQALSTATNALLR